MAGAGPTRALLARCRALPKVELHAHLSGSIPGAVLARFAEEDAAAGRPAVAGRDLAMLRGAAGARDLRDCFRFFPLIHRLVNSRVRLAAATAAVLAAFEEDNIVYAELRTTPRDSPALSARAYVDTVLGAVAAHRGPLAARVVLSLDRAAPRAAAERTAALAREVLLGGHAHAHLVAGVELSGNPSFGAFASFAPVLAGLRAEFGPRLPVALHFAELEDDDEAAAMLAFGARRLGHAARMSPITARKLLASDACVEVCLSSNLATLAVPNLDKHPVVTTLAPAGHPFCICTDDSDVFQTTLSREYALLQTLLPDADLMEVTRTAIRYSFAPAELKESLLDTVARYKPS